MGVALAALAVAMGGTGFAAADAFEDTAGVVQGCVTQSNIVRDVTGAVDAVTGGALAPVTAGANALVDATKVVTPKGTVLAVAAGKKCPAGSTPQSLAAPAPIVADRARAVPLGASRTALTATDLPAGRYLITSTVKGVARGDSSVLHTYKCALTGPGGKTIPGTTSQATIGPRARGERVTIPIIAVVTVPAGKVSTVCNDSTPAEKSAANGPRAAQRTQPVDEFLGQQISWRY
jgi:hypothetical protein